MFKGCVILEQTETQVKIKHTATGDISLRYKAKCSNCFKDRGWQKAFKLNGLCKSCSQHLEFLKNLDKSKYPNVNFEDSIKHEKPNKGSEVRYKTSCLSCHTNRGYLPISSVHKLCRSCSRKEIHANTSQDEKDIIAKKISMTQTGHEIFSGFTTPENEKQRGIFKSKELSRQTFIRDNYTCQCCSVKGNTLHAHHKNSFDKFPDQRFDLSNLITLCRVCHDSFHTEFGKGKNTEEQFEQFKAIRTKKPLIILTGAPASGKTWVSSQLSNYDVIDSDIIRKKDLVARCEAVSKPLLTLTVGVSTFINNNPQFDVQMIVIQEDKLIIEQRMLNRGGKITKTIERRIKRMVSLAQKAIFVGTAQETLKFLRSK